MKEQVSRLAKSAVVQYVTVFRIILAKQVKHCSRLETERHHIVNFDVGGYETLASKRSLWESNLFSHSKSKAVLKAGLYVSGILSKSTVSAKFTCDDLCGESESY